MPRNFPADLCHVRMRQFVVVPMKWSSQHRGTTLHAILVQRLCIQNTHLRLRSNRIAEHFCLAALHKLTNWEIKHFVHRRKFDKRDVLVSLWMVFWHQTTLWAGGLSHWCQVMIGDHNFHQPMLLRHVIDEIRNRNRLFLLSWVSLENHQMAVSLDVPR